MLPTTLYKSLKNPLMIVLGRAIYCSQNPKPEFTVFWRNSLEKTTITNPNNEDSSKDSLKITRNFYVYLPPKLLVGIKTMILADVKKLNKKNTWKAQVTVHWWVALPQLPLLIWGSTLENGTTSLVFLFGWGSNPYVSTWVKPKKKYIYTPVN